MSKGIESSTIESFPSDAAKSSFTDEPVSTAEEAKRLRRLQMMMNMVMQVIAQDATLTVEDASQMIADARSPRLQCFPAKSLRTISSGGRAFNASCANIFA